VIELNGEIVSELWLDRATLGRRIRS
jgi:hypothetical protein